MASQFLLNSDGNSYALYRMVMLPIIIIIIITELVRRPLQGLSGAVQYNADDLG